MFLKEEQISGTTTMRQIRLIIAALLMISPFSANADLIGVEIDASSIFLSPASAVVGGGVEFSFIDITFDFTGTQLIVSHGNDDHSFIGFGSNTFSGLWWDGDPNAGFITGLDIVSDTGVSQNFLNSLSFTGDTISFSLVTPDLDFWRANSVVVIDILVSHSVPEPGTLALLGIGLFGMGLARRRKQA